MTNEEPIMATLAPIAERGLILTDMMLGLSGLHTTRSWLHVEWQGGAAPVEVTEWADGWSAPSTRRWRLQLTSASADITIHDSAMPYHRTLPPMDALIYMHASLRDRRRSRDA